MERGLQLFDGCFYRDGAMERLLEKQNADDNEATTNVEAHDNLFEVGNDVEAIQLLRF